MAVAEERPRPQQQQQQQQQPAPAQAQAARGGKKHAIPIDGAKHSPIKHIPSPKPSPQSSPNPKASPRVSPGVSPASSPMKALPIPKLAQAASPERSSHSPVTPGKTLQISVKIGGDGGRSVHKVAIEEEGLGNRGRKGAASGAEAVKTGGGGGNTRPPRPPRSASPAGGHGGERLQVGVNLKKDGGRSVQVGGVNPKAGGSKGGGSQRFVVYDSGVSGGAGRPLRQ